MNLTKELFHGLNEGGQAEESTLLFQQRSINQTLVPFAYQQNGLPSCCLYEDPLKFAANKEQFLLLDMKFGQNVNYFLDYLHDIREFLRFSASVRLQGERAFKQLKMDVASAMCVHVRRGDFLELNLAVNKTDIVRVTTKIANEQRLHQYLIFGDDAPFMKEIAKSLMRSGTMDGSPYVSCSFLFGQTHFPTFSNRQSNHI
ncbi:hypothetical protein Q1695_009269 [Nippostrongylus brasiliensis]|nr:hypothetical protein Q1695_009269 [Nippostrongylus brasiliensis]